MIKMIFTSSSDARHTLITIINQAQDREIFSYNYMYIKFHILGLENWHFKIQLDCNSKSVDIGPSTAISNCI